MRMLYTVTTTAAREVKQGTGTQNPINFAFVFRNAADLKVTVVDVNGVESVKTITTDYTVSGGGTPPAAGSITPVSFTPGATDQVVIERVSALTQPNDLKRQDPLPAEVLEAVLDNAIMRVQELVDRLGLAVQLPLTTDPSTAPNITIPEPQVGKYLIGGSTTRWDLTDALIADGDVTTAKIADGAVTTVKIADANVTTAKIANDAVTAVKIADGNVATGELANSAVSTLKIADDAITLDKIAHGTQGGLIYFGVSGAPTELAVGTAGQALLTQGAGANPQWAAVPQPVVFVTTGVSSLGSSSVFIGLATSNASEPVVQFPAPRSGTVKNFYGHLSAAPGTGASRTININKNGVNQTVSLSFGVSDTDVSDTSNSFSVVAGDLLSVRDVPSGTPAAARFSGSFTIES